MELPTVVSENDRVLINKIPIKKGDVILIELKNLEMPAAHYRRYAEDVKKTFVDSFPDNMCIVIPQGSLGISIISPEDAVKIKLSNPSAV